ncbi:MAG: translation initiation factor IF-2 N-terminal domain-containing protein, partial [Phycisphaerales bacterium]|nr:translation initiation factor IF-2 N-terminal domain-containing protein [Phycisphaerales bacterium]
MAKTIRLHTLAKELGVPSKAIMDKCKAEGIELKNHMAAISLGLAESIKEWFSTGHVTTAVEVSEHVDVTKLPKRRAKKGVAEEAGDDHGIEDAIHLPDLPVAESSAAAHPEVEVESEPAVSEEIVTAPAAETHAAPAPQAELVVPQPRIAEASRPMPTTAPVETVVIT